MLFARKDVAALVATAAILSIIRSVAAAPGGMVSLPNEPIAVDENPANPEPASNTEVDTQTGALSYSYPIALPPVARGVVPRLSLQYASRGQIYGDIAAGWTIGGIPAIEVDISTAVPLSELESSPGGPYVSTLAGGARLVRVSEPATNDVVASYRAMNDPSYAKYELLACCGDALTWRVRTSDGITYMFGQKHQYTGGEAGWQLSPVVKAPLTMIVDAFGNQTRLFYVEGRLDRIEYATNRPAGYAKPHAEVTFHYRPATWCSSEIVGADINYRAGRWRRNGTRGLGEIRTHAIDPDTGEMRLARSIELGYDLEAERCDAPHGPQRELESIKETAYAPDGTATELPLTRLGYGERSRSLDRTLTMSLPTQQPGAPEGAVIWGTRDRSEYRWPTVDSMLLDIDSDGFNDRIYSIDTQDGCEMGIDRGTADGFVATSRRVALPSLSGPKVQHKACSLTAQEVRIETNTHATCSIGKSYFAYRFMDVDGDTRLDLVAALDYDPHGFNPKNAWELGLPNPPGVPATHHTGLMSDAHPCLPGTIPHRIDFDYPWYVYRNSGDGSFATDPEVWMAPVRLTADTGDTSMGAGRLAFIEPDQGVADFNGDGLLDAWSAESFDTADNPGNDHWQVWFSNGDGFDAPIWWSIPTRFKTRMLTGNLSNVDGERRRAIAEMRALYDANGDGLVDLIAIEPSWGINGQLIARPRVHYNRGDGFQVEHPSILRSQNVYVLSMALIDYYGSNPYTRYISRGLRWSSQGPLDVDADGRIDWFWPVGVEQTIRTEPGDDAEPEDDGGGGNGGSIPLIGTFSTTSSAGSMTSSSRLIGVPIGPSPGPGTIDPGDGGGSDDHDGFETVDASNGYIDPSGTTDTTVVYGWERQVAFNQGGKLGDPQPVGAGLDEGLAETVRFESDHWFVTGRMIDVTGDGLPDDVILQSDGTLRVNTDALGAAPLRLLRRIDNGRGRVLRINYAPHTDPSVVLQSPALGKSMTQHEWVVSSIETDDAFSADSTTSYHYKWPRVEPDWAGRYGFRGFESVSTRLPLGGVIVERFDYDLDPEGRKVDTLTYRGFAGVGDDWYRRPNRLETVEHTGWTQLRLFGDIVSHQREVSEHWTCGSSGPPTDIDPGDVFPDYDSHIDRCKGAGLVKSTTSSWSPHPSSNPRLYALGTSYTLRRPAADAWTTPAKPGDRLTGYQHHYQASTHVLAEKERKTTDLHTWSVIGHTITRWDSMWRAPKQIERLQAVRDGTAIWGTTVLEYDAAGLLVGRQDPQQVAEGGGVKETYQHDPWGLFVWRVTNELGHEVRRHHDYATGALLRELGPNSEPCSGSGCIDGRRWQESRYVIDGLGRAVREEVSHGDSYQPAWVVRRVFDDLRYQRRGAPVRMREDKRISFRSTTYTRTFTDMDGAGRVVRVQKESFGDGSDTVTSFEYDAGGNVVAQHVPDPSDDTGSVTFRRTYDGLGRLESMRGPDGTGFDLVRFGLQTTRNDYVPGLEPDDVLGARVEIRDELGRLTEVREKGRAGWAVTTYSHDGHGNLSGIVHPDGRQVVIEHDLAGNRTAIEVGDARWTYNYDLNGNLRSKTLPHPSSASPVDYTVSYLYDDLDRIEYESPGAAGLTPGQRQKLAVGSRHYVYDEGRHGLGQLTRVELPWGLIEKEYSARGKLVFERRSFDLETAIGTPLADSREIRRSYGALGQPETVSYEAGRAGEVVNLEYRYDRRGRADGVWLERPGEARVLLSEAELGRSGQVKSLTNLGSQTHTLEYDLLGRVTGEIVAVSGDEVLAEVVRYWKSGNVRSVTSDYDGLTPRAIEYKYDPQHQLREATGSAGFYGEWEIGKGGRLESVRIDAPSTPSEVRARDVGYLYEDPRHPEAVTALASTDARPSIEYAYDAAGNLVRRQDGAEVWTFEYDGSHRKRVARLPDGSEEVHYYVADGERQLSVELDSGGGFRGATLWFGELEVHYSANTAADSGFVNLQLAGRRIARASADADPIFTYHNHLGSLIGTITADGVLEAAYVYGPYGAILDQTGSSPDTRRFNGKILDAGSQLLYYGYRYYDPVSLQWTQGDPLLRFAPEIGLEEPRRLNLYSFSLNNPLRYIDPDGRNSCPPEYRECAEDTEWEGQADPPPPPETEPESEEEKGRLNPEVLMDLAFGFVSDPGATLLLEYGDTNYWKYASELAKVENPYLMMPKQKGFFSWIKPNGTNAFVLKTGSTALGWIGTAASASSLVHSIQDGDKAGIVRDGADTGMGMVGIVGTAVGSAGAAHAAVAYGTFRASYDATIWITGGENGWTADVISDAIMYVFGPLSFKQAGPCWGCYQSQHHGRYQEGGPQP